MIGKAVQKRSAELRIIGLARTTPSVRLLAVSHTAKERRGDE